MSQVAPVRPMTQGGQTHLVYELIVSNRGVAPLTLTSLEVAGNGPTRVLEGEALAAETLVRASERGALTVAPGASAIIYRWEVLGDERPTALAHVLNFDGHDPLSLTVAVEASEVPAWRLPFDGEGWFTANAPSNTSPHRRSLQGIDGAVFSAQRFAYDFVRVNAGTFSGDPKDNASYFCYRQPVLAMADGIVRKVIDGIPENVPGLESRAVPIDNQTLVGNAVLVEHGPAHFATYAHLVPGEIPVREGQRVSRGEVLGLVGNSGNSTEPHLHLHVCDAPDTLRCHGTPFAFERFTEIGVVIPTSGPPEIRPPQVRTNTLPINSAVLTMQEP